jgi:hypothetical protein
MTYIDCSSESILTVIDLLELKGIMSIYVRLYPVRDNAELQEMLAEFKMKHDVSLETVQRTVRVLFGPNHEEFVETLLFTGTVDECREFIADVFKFEITDILVANIMNEETWSEEILRHGRGSINNNDLYASIWSDASEPYFFMMLNGSIYDGEAVVRRIKETFG